MLPLNVMTNPSACCALVKGWQEQRWVVFSQVEILPSPLPYDTFRQEHHLNRICLLVEIIITLSVVNY